MGLPGAACGCPEKYYGVVLDENNRVVRIQQRSVISFECGRNANARVLQTEITDPLKVFDSLSVHIQAEKVIREFSIWFQCCR